MTDAEKLSTLAALTGEDNTSLLEVELDLAAGRILERAYPFVSDTSNMTVPDKYARLQVRLAQDMWARRGGEGETSHTESGLTRAFEDSDKLLSEIIPHAGIIGIPMKITSFTVSEIADQVYTGAAITPEVIVKNGLTLLTGGTDYTVAYANNTDVGTATVTITGIGNYTGTLNATFLIVGA